MGANCIFTKENAESAIALDHIGRDDYRLHEVDTNGKVLHQAESTKFATLSLSSLGEGGAKVYTGPHGYGGNTYYKDISPGDRLQVRVGTRDVVIIGNTKRDITLNGDKADKFNNKKRFPVKP